MTPADHARMWTLDERVGCVAVYAGPKRNCLTKIADSLDCVFYAEGVWFADGWVIAERDLARARRCYAALVAGAAALEREAGLPTREECEKAIDRLVCVARAFGEYGTAPREDESISAVLDLFARCGVGGK